MGHIPTLLVDLRHQKINQLTVFTNTRVTPGTVSGLRVNRLGILTKFPTTGGRS
jgi:hypothetical protein